MFFNLRLALISKKFDSIIWVCQGGGFVFAPSFWKYFFFQTGDKKQEVEGFVWRKKGQMFYELKKMKLEKM